MILGSGIVLSLFQMAVRFFSFTVEMSVGLDVLRAKAIDMRLGGKRNNREAMLCVRIASQDIVFLVCVHWLYMRQTRWPSTFCNISH